MKYLKTFENIDNLELEEKAQYHRQMIKAIFQEWIDEFDIIEMQDIDDTYERGMYYNLKLNWPLSDFASRLLYKKIFFQLTFWWNMPVDDDEHYKVEQALFVSEKAVERLKSAGYECKVKENEYDIQFEISCHY
jgi:hypothetical protein